MKINLVMIVKNEERSLERCLEAAAPFVDDIVIADTGSTDRTTEILRNFGQRLQEQKGRECLYLYHYAWTNDFSAARNFILDLSQKEHGADYHLVLDADEYMLSDSSERMNGITEDSYAVDRKDLEDFILRQEKQHGHAFMGAIGRYDAYEEADGNGQNISQNIAFIPRILPANVRYEGRIHEQPTGQGPIIKAPVYAWHDGYLQGGKGERNLKLLLESEKEAPEDPYIQYQLAVTLKNLKRLPESLPHFRAFYGAGERNTGYWRDGIMLFLYSLYDMGTPDALGEASGIMVEVQEELDSSSEYHFYAGLFYMKLVLLDTRQYIGFFPLIEQSYLKCMEIGEQPLQGGVVGTGSFKAAYNLGLYYEMSGNKENAEKYYMMAAGWGYEPARARLSAM